MRGFIKRGACFLLWAASLPAMAIFTNGGFESGDFTGWTQSNGINNGLTLPEPFTGASINLGAGGAFRGEVVTTGAVDLVGAPITLPFAGKFTARVNNAATGGIANGIAQQDTITAADRDPSDNKLHVRFAYAVVLEDPSHDHENQPFFYLSVRNVTKSTVLFEDFSFAGQTGTQFQPVPNNTDYLYLNWKQADIVVPDADEGDVIEVYLLASDCEPQGHAGYAYLDGFGSRVVVPPGKVVTPVPTMGEISLLALGLLLAGAGASTLRRRRR